MKLLTNLFTGLFLIVLCGISHAQSPSTANPLIGEWEFVETTLLTDNTSLTRKQIGSVIVNETSFSGQLKDAAAPISEQPEKLSGAYIIDKANGIVTVFFDDDRGIEKMVFRYKLVQKNGENYLELELSPEDSFDKKELSSISSNDLETLKRIKFSFLLKRK